MPTVPRDRYSAEGAKSVDDWRAHLDRIGEEAGYFEPIGARHHTFFNDLAPVLLVSFEELSSLRDAAADQMPLGYRVASARGWSSLTIIADGASWFRDRHLWGYFDRLIDEGFFEDFDRVAFYGAGMGGYAASAYAVVAPGCRVLALAPRATLDPATAPWDRRDLTARRLDFRSRYGFAPDMVAGTEATFLIHDPLQALDAAHAALFRGPQVTHLRARHIGPDPAAALSRLDLLVPLIEAVVDGTISAALFHRLSRARRDDPAWLGRLAARAQATGGAVRLARACRAALARSDHPRLRLLLAEAEAEIETESDGGRA
ncbi:hypothetical protein [Pararhodobacter sp. SW119]|uniref:hypothetical protein n=1 Tax=Pararhodobacter sp. SW119 TaxID=2780075 RepID=UPI001AE0B91F|nr:hypothetical protein [Pararhodobacter sp. SW119]